MTKLERKLLKHLAETYYFILCLRDDAIRRKDGYYVGQTEGIEVSIQKLKSSQPAFVRYFNEARKKAVSIGKQQTEAKNTAGEKRRKEKEVAIKGP